MRLRNTARTLRNEVAQIGFDAARTLQPDTARTAFTDHIARRQRASMQHSLSAKPCGETPRAQSRVAQSDRNGLPLEPSCALWLCWFQP